MFSPLIGQVFRRECRIGGASEFTTPSSFLRRLQSKSCAFPLFLSIHPFFPSPLPPPRFFLLFIPLFAREKIFSLHFSRRFSSSSSSSSPATSSSRKTSRSRAVRRIHDDLVGFNFARPAETELAGLSVRKLCFPHGRSIFASCASPLHVSLRSIPCIYLSIRDTR